MVEEHWRILLPETQCPHRVKLDEQLHDGSIYMCGLMENPEDNPYCSITNCKKKEY